jgi:heparan-alpha-glucosaminide N-acetyltransferase
MTKPSSPAPARIASVDAYRGFVMFLMMAEVLELRRVSRALLAAPGNGPPGLINSIWEFLAHHQEHAAWAGCSLHDLIQPSFSFLVGVALPFSIASRVARGQGPGSMLLHAAWRSLVLLFLGIFLRSVGRSHTNFTFEDTLTQIGLGYFFLFLFGLGRPYWWWSALVIILVAYWAAFALYPLPGPDFDYGAAGVPANWQHNYAGFAAHWNKNTNLAWAFDRWFLNKFPRENTFRYNGGGYATLSFIPTLGTMILGLIAGKWLRGSGSHLKILRTLVVTGVFCLAAGILADQFGICPSVKRIWTPAWTLFSGGWCFLLMAAFYASIDAIRSPGWSFPLRVIGMNSIAAYCMAHLLHNFIVNSYRTHLGKEFFLGWGTAYEPLLTGAAVLAVYWLILYWMYRRSIFLRI